MRAIRVVKGNTNEHALFTAPVVLHAAERAACLLLVILCLTIDTTQR